MHRKTVQQSVLLTLAIFILATSTPMDGKAMWGSPTPKNITSLWPDLIVSSVEVKAVSATTITYEFVITNDGLATADIDGPSVELDDNVARQGILSMDTVWGNSGDAAAGGGYITSPASLDPGESFTKTVSAGPLVDPRIYTYIGVWIDQHDVLVESNNGNNIGWAPIFDVEVFLPLIKN